MSENNNTNSEEILNEEKKTIRFSVSAEVANEILQMTNAPTPDASELDEIVLVITK